MSNYLLLDSTAEGVGSQLEILRKQAINATLGRLLCDSPDRPAEAEYTSLNDSHTMWHRYASQLGTHAKIEIPKLLTPERMQHPAFTSATEWLGSRTLQILKQETAIRADIYETAVGYDVHSRTAMSQNDEDQILHRIDHSWEEIGTQDLRHAPYVLAQIASTALLNTTLRQHIREENILTNEFQLVS